MSNTFDCAIIGMGVAGVFACYKMSKENKNLKIIGFDLGRPQGKRRRQIDGWLGCLPNSDGKLYTHDLLNVAELVGTKKTNSAHKYVMKTLSQINDFKIIKDKSPSISMDKKLKKAGYDYYLNDFMQVYPKDVHVLSKYIATDIEPNKSITLSFDNEIYDIVKQKNIFQISTERGSFSAKKIIIAVGRSGWRWASKLYKKLGIIDNNDVARFGIRIEMNSNHLKDFNKSHVTITKGDDLEIGPLSWFGTVIPEDHVDVAISAFRSNENRWKTDKVSFSLIGNRPFPDLGFEQTDRISKLTFILTNDRIIKERVSTILAGKSKISIIPEYEWLKSSIEELAVVIPEVITKGYYHVPTIMPLPPKINIGDNLESEIDGMYVVGEAAGIHGILAAANMGAVVAQEITK